MGKGMLFLVCLIALLSGITYLVTMHSVSVIGIVVFIGLPLALGGCVYAFGGK